MGNNMFDNFINNLYTEVVVFDSLSTTEKINIFLSIIGMISILMFIF